MSDDAMPRDRDVDAPRDRSGEPGTPPPPDRPDGPGTPPADDGEVLSAYLTGDLPPDDAHALEERLRNEPGLAARLEDLHRTLTALRRMDQVEVPDGFRARLRARLEAERTAQEASGAEVVRLTGRASSARAGAADGRALSPGSRRGRGRPMHRRRRSPALTAVAATIAAFAFVGLSAATLWFQGMGGDADEASMAGADGGTTEESVRSLAQEDAGPPAPGAAEQAVPRAPADATVMEEAQDAPAAAGEAAPQGEAGAADTDALSVPAMPEESPVLRDEGIVLDSEDDARAHFTELPDVAALLGTPAADSAARSEAFRQRLAAVEDTYPGAPLAACLDETSAAAGPQAVPVRLETVVYRGEPSLAFVFVAPGGDAADTAQEAELDRIRVAIVDGSCTPQAEFDFSP